MCWHVLVEDLIIYFQLNLLQLILWFVFSLGQELLVFGWLWFMVYSGVFGLQWGFWSGYMYLQHCIVLFAVGIDFHLFRLIYHILAFSLVAVWQFLF